MVSYTALTQKLQSGDTLFTILLPLASDPSTFDLRLWGRYSKRELKSLTLSSLYDLISHCLRFNLASAVAIRLVNSVPVPAACPRRQLL